jgi:hypothetical protein
MVWTDTWGLSGRSSYLQIKKFEQVEKEKAILLFLFAGFLLQSFHKDTEEGQSCEIHTYRFTDC